MFMNMSGDQTTIPTPPYATVGKVSEMFDLLNSRSFPSINPSDLQNRGFSAPDAFQVVATLKFLGLLNEDNTKTEQLPKIQQRGDKKAIALREIVTNSYRLLFSVIPEANKLTRDELHNEFMAIYKVSTRVARSAAPLFIWLCKQAGMDTKEDVIPKDRVSKFSNPKASSKQRVQTKTNTSNSFSMSTFGLVEGYQVFPIGKIKLLIPSEEKYLSPVMNGELKEIKKQIEAFINNVESKIEETPVGSGNQAID